MNPHLAHLLSRRPDLEVCGEEINEIFVAMCRSLRNGGRLLLCGNGGSASDAEHWAGELLKGFMHKRPLLPKEKELLPEHLRDKLQGAIPAIPLTGFPSLSTAFGNDVDPSLTFAQLVWGLGKEGDVLVGISTSGNAKNVCAAMEVAKAKRIVRVGLTGRGGGKLAGLTDFCLHAPSSETYQIQECHLAVYHCLSIMLEAEFFPPDQR